MVGKEKAVPPTGAPGELGHSLRPGKALEEVSRRLWLPPSSGVEPGQGCSRADLAPYSPPVGGMDTV